MTTVSQKPFYLYNTLTRTKELFKPLHAPKVGIYNCGPTVYKDIHIGNLRSFTTTDWLRRALEYNGYDVTLVRNITDVGHLHEDDDARGGEDKLEHEARATGRSAYEIAEHYTAQYLRDCDAMNILPPHLLPKATEHIPEMIALTEKLIARDLAYVSAGNVYYAVSHFKKYGALSGNTIENLRSGGHGRVQMEVAEDKQNNEDFALWKHGDAARQMNWESPWGTGFPGWHIECSAMATKYLGEQFDIHTGGIDLVFPHHEDEIAQSQGATDKQPVQYWVHNEFLDLGNSKMSRSVGNIVLLSTLKERGIEPMAFRYLLLTAHYRAKLNFTDDSINAAQNALNNLRSDLSELPVTPALAAWSDEALHRREAFHDAINNDLDFPIALSIAREAARTNKIDPAERRHLLLDFDRVLGLQLDQVAPKTTQAINAEVQDLVRLRDAARSARDWKESDRLRDQLKELGFEVRDTPQGTKLV